MKATYMSVRNESSIINLIFNPDKPADRAKAEAIESILNEIGYQSIIEEEDMIQVAMDNMTIQEMRDDYNSAKAELKSREAAE